MERAAKTGLLAGIEFLYLLMLWTAFLGKLDKQTVSAGIAVALIGTIGDAVVKARMAHFSPKAKWVFQFVFLPWHVAEGTWTAARSFGRALLGKRSRARFMLTYYKTVRNDAQSAARRTLAEAYISIPPNSMIVGIDKDAKRVLIHELEPEVIPRMGKILGIEG